VTETSICGEPPHDTIRPAGSSDGALKGFQPGYKAQNTVFVNGSPAPHGTLAPTWRDAGSKTVKQVDHRTLAEYLIGSEAKIVLPESYWPKDKVSWTSQCMDHRENKRAKGNHTFKCILRHKTLDEMFGGKTRGLAGLATDRLRSAVRKASTKMPGVKIRRHESFITTGAAMMGMIWTAIACDEHGQQLAGMRPVPRN